MSDLLAGARKLIAFFRELVDLEWLPKFLFCIISGSYNYFFYLYLRNWPIISLEF